MKHGLRTAAAFAALLFLTTALPAQGETPAAPVPQSAKNPAAARIPQSELGSEFWSLTARFETGEHLMIELCISNVGLGDSNAAVIGHLIEADGTVHSFDGAKSQGEWTLSDDRLRVVIGKLELDQRGPVHRLRISKERVRVDLAFEAASENTRLAELTSQGRGFDLLGTETAIAGRLWTEGHPERPVQGRLVRTHRWAEELESSYVLRRIELFTLDGDTSVYLIEATDPSGGAESWLRVQRNDEVIVAERVSTTLIWTEAPLPEGFPLPKAIEIEGENVHGRFELGTDLVRYDPLRDLPAPVRWVLAPFIRWRTAWSTTPFELEITTGPEGPMQLHGSGVSNVTYFNEVSPAMNVAAPPAEVTCGREC
ncbi:MAG: hypothetical protein GY723_09645 [bacterium]|nr:hypothetical protein [bacterium]MCP5066267.1 hypothetical protein [bacterium]